MRFFSKLMLSSLLASAPHICPGIKSQDRSLLFYSLANLQHPYWGRGQH